MSRVFLLMFSAVAAISFASGNHHRSVATFAKQNPVNQVDTVTEGHGDLEASFIEAVGYHPHVLSFAHFAHRYGKKYKTVEEIKKRFEIFRENLLKIESHNEKGLSYTLGINAFTDMTWEEFSERMLGDVHPCNPITDSSLKFTYNISSPNKFKKDWREDGIIGPVKDQGNLESTWLFSWAFSGTGAIEAAYAQANNKKIISLSEQQIIDCADESYSRTPSQAFQYVKDSGGIDTEESYPYEGKKGTCRFTKENVGARVDQSVFLNKGETTLMLTLRDLQPVSVAVKVFDDFKQYKSGIYSNDRCISAKEMNHALLAVGYDADDVTGVRYYILKNSWGTDWGMDGYMHIEMLKDMCGIGNCAAVPFLEGWDGREISVQ